MASDSKVFGSFVQIERQKVYDPNTMTWVAEQQATGGGGGSGVVDQGNSGIDPWLVDATGSLVDIDPLQLLPISGAVSGSGNTAILSPAAGKKLRVYYLSYNPASPTEAAFRFGAGGTMFLRNDVVVGGSIIAKDFGDHRYVEGTVDQNLYIYQSNAVTTIWNAFYVEI